MGTIVGIDLGTTYTLVATIDPKTKKPVLLKNRLGNTTTPSVIGFNPDGTYVIGEDAKNMEEAGDVNTASFYKIHMGDRKYKYSFYGKKYTARDLSSLFLKQLIKDINDERKDKITKAVITVPAYFEDAAKADTRSAGEDSGLEVLNIIAEPTAACIAYGLNSGNKSQKILIYDLGGGTFDVTIAEMQKDRITVRATKGIHQLGGRDWDSALVDWLNDKFLEETGVDISQDNELFATNMNKAEKAKKQLSLSNSTEIVVDDGQNKCRFKLTRDEFETITSFQLGQTTELIDQMMTEIGMNWSDIDGAVLVGGSTRMPMVKNYLTERNVNILSGIHPDEAVAIGAAIQANTSEYCALEPSKKKKSSMLLDTDADDYDFERLPGSKKIEDVIPHSLGMIMANRDETRFVNDIMIKCNTLVSAAKTTKRRELRVAKRKERNTLDIYLLQGESIDIAECSYAKRYVFYDIEYIPGGKTLLDITFEHTHDGIIAISAVQTETGKKLLYREEEIPEDMSWVERSPKELMAEQQKESIRGTLLMGLDVSGSMTIDNAIEKAKKAMNNFVDQFEGKGIQIGIFAFSDLVIETCDPTEDMNIVHRAINSILVAGIDGSAPKHPNKNVGGGNAANPLGRMLAVLKSCDGKPHDKGNTEIKQKPVVDDPFSKIVALQPKKSREERRVEADNRIESDEFMYSIVLTDGVWDRAACNSAINDRKLYEKEGYEIIGMGFGSADLAFLKEISTRDELASVDDISRLDEKLSSIARIIGE